MLFSNDKENEIRKSYMDFLNINQNSIENPYKQVNVLTKIEILNEKFSNMKDISIEQANKSRKINTISTAYSKKNLSDYKERLSNPSWSTNNSNISTNLSNNHSKEVNSVRKDLFKQGCFDWCGKNIV